MDKNVKLLSSRAVDAAQVPTGLSMSEDARVVFAVATRAYGSETAVVSASGDVDLVTAPELERELVEAVQLGVERVLVDLTATTFFDSSAIHALVRGGERLHASGLQLGVVCSSPSVRRVLEITGVDRILPIDRTIQSALCPDVSGPEPGDLAAARPEPAHRGRTGAAAGAFASLARHVQQAASRPEPRSLKASALDHEGRTPA